MIRVCVLLFAGLAVGAVIIDGAVKARARTRWHALGGEVAEATLGGSLPRLLRQQLVGLRALAEEPAPAELAANVAYLNAVLACEHGQPTERMAREALARATPAGGSPGATAIATDAMLSLCQGDSTRALALARTALDAAGATGDVPAAGEAGRAPHALLVLGRAHLLRGELQAASQVLEAAAVRAPASATALIGWAEARLGLGERAGVIESLREALRRAPGDTRALLLLEEAARATGDGGTTAVARERAQACARDAANSPPLAVACQLAAAVEARAGGDRKRAAELAREVDADKQAATRERVLASLVLAQTGDVDAAAALLARLGAGGEEALPLRAWAQAAVSLGRGELAPPGLPSPPVHPETHLVAARAALAGGGHDALAGALAALGAPAVAADADLNALAMLTTGAGDAATAGATAGGTASAGASASAGTSASAGASASAGTSASAGASASVSASAGDPPATPVHAYARGLRALAAGDPTTASRWLAQALAGHGDACRALAVYLPTLALTGRVPGDELATLGTTNAGCRDLRWVDTAPAQAAEPATNTKTN
jgi:tetratricopeptide (TPR) repeat protein